MDMGVASQSSSQVSLLNCDNLAPVPTFIPFGVPDS